MALAGAAVVALTGVGVASAAPGGMHPYLVGGHQARTAPPGMVSVQFDAPTHGRRYVNFHACGGVLVFRGWVATNAHCVTDMPSGGSAQRRQLAARYHRGWTAKPIPTADKHFHVRVGSLEQTRGGETATVTKIVVHPGWQWAKGAPQAAVDDIAMLKLDHLLQQPTLPLASTPATPGQTIALFGWGDTEPDSHSRDLPVKLQQLDTTVTSSGVCDDPTFSAKEICTNNPNGTDGSCFGDSGGPAVAMIDGVAQLVGNASRAAGQFCGTTGTVYTSSPEFRGWVYGVARGGAAS